MWTWASSNSWLFSNNCRMERFQNHKHILIYFEPVPASCLDWSKVVWLLKTTSWAPSRAPQVHSCLAINHYASHSHTVPHTWIPRKFASGSWKIKLSLFMPFLQRLNWMCGKGDGEQTCCHLDSRFPFDDRGLCRCTLFAGMWRMTGYEMTERWTMSSINQK